MNQKLFSGLTAALLISTLGLAPSGYADQARNSDEQSGAQVPESSVAINQVASASAQASTAAPNSVVSAVEPEGQSSPEATAASETKVAAPAAPTREVATTSTPVSSGLAIPQLDEVQPTEAVKVGEYQSRDSSRANGSVATIQPHILRGRQAATLYVRNIPVLTFLGNEETAANPTGSAAPSESEVKVASVQTPIDTSVTATPDSNQSIATKLTTPTVAPSAALSDNHDPVWRATTAAARLNQLYRDQVNADEIKISWNADRQKYVIQADDKEIVVLDADSVLPDTVGSSASDVLQVTNRIRRQMGNAAPLSSIEGDPNGYGQISLGPLSLRVSGYASWYGPGFDGGYSANGEVFNQEALTAAHPSLPFGTQVRVTNLDNGQSVTVRITDRGPYAHDRVIDLSTGAARVIGLIQAGVAPVSLEVLGAAQTASNPY